MLKQKVQCTQESLSVANDNKQLRSLSARVGDFIIIILKIPSFFFTLYPLCFLVMKHTIDYQPIYNTCYYVLV